VLTTPGFVCRAEPQAFWRTNLVPLAPRFSVQAIFSVVCGALLLTIAAFATSLYSTATAKVTRILKLSMNDAGQAIRYPQGGIPEVTMFRVEIPPRGERSGTRIRSPASYTLSGTLAVALKGDVSRASPRESRSHRIRRRATRWQERGSNAGRSRRRLISERTVTQSWLGRNG
jgi:hypothetical protein